MIIIVIIVILMMMTMMMTMMMMMMMMMMIITSTLNMTILSVAMITNDNHRFLFQQTFSQLLEAVQVELWRLWDLAAFEVKHHRWKLGGEKTAFFF